MAWSIDGARVVITGATSGIGRAMAHELASRGARLTLLARDARRAAATAAELPGEPDVVTGDLADLASVRSAAAEILARYDKVDVLVNNAGMRSFRPHTTVDGFEQMAATNCLGPFLLTDLLLEALRAAPAARVVVTASEAHRLAGRPDLDLLAAPVSFGMRGAEQIYGQTKLLNILFTQELARRLDATNVTANCFCPGAVATGLVRDTALLDIGARILSRTPLIRTPEQGARMGVRLVADPDLEGMSGRFFTSTAGLRRLRPVAARADLDYQRRAWDRTAELVESASE